MKFLVTGGAGYLGSVLVPSLLARGHEVRVLDVGYFGLDHLRKCRPLVDIVRDDLRQVTSDPARLSALLSGCDAVIHLAAISNDPSAELRPELTREVNFEATARLAEAARDHGLRFVFSSSCSVYGESHELIDESGALAPLTAYAISKVDAEKVILELADPSWRPVILRNGTLFGFSPRMRFDLVVNIFSLFAALEGQIRVFGTGQQWRPFLHVRDCARAFIHFAELSPSTDIVFNVMHENLRVVDLAKLFQELRVGLRVLQEQVAEPDRRDYRVTASRATASGFHPRVPVIEGAEEVISAIVSGSIADPESIFYRNAKWMKELTNFGPADHGGFMTFVETLARSRQPSRA